MLADSPDPTGDSVELFLTDTGQLALSDVSLLYEFVDPICTIDAQSPEYALELNSLKAVILGTFPDQTTDGVSMWIDGTEQSTYAASDRKLQFRIDSADQVPIQDIVVYCSDGLPTDNRASTSLALTPSIYAFEPK